MIQNKKQIIWRIIKDFLDKPLRKVFVRWKKIFFQEKIKKVYTIIWPRRAWKSYFCFQTIKNLIKNWVKKENILYFNIENDELDLKDINDLNLILNTFFEIVDFDINKKYYIFFDEIQEIQNWERFVRKILDNFENIQIVITWSSSKLLSKELATNLRWRSLLYEILPLSFEEVLDWKNLKKNYFSTDEEIKNNQLKSNFLNHWSFPEIVLSQNIIENKKILRDYLDLIFYKDIIERNNFKDIKKIKDFRKYLISFIWDFLSLKNIENNLNINYRTIQNWLEAFKDAFLIFELKKFDFSIFWHQRSISKIYLIDNWFYNLLFWDYKEDFWKLFENLIFLELRKKWFVENENIFYFKNKNFDIDFILFENGKIIPIQVCYELNSINFDREYTKFDKFLWKFWIKKWYLIYFENNFHWKLDSDLVDTLRFEDFQVSEPGLGKAPSISTSSIS